jgi:hypothetical protein
MDKNCSTIFKLVSFPQKHGVNAIQITLQDRIKDCSDGIHVSAKLVQISTLPKT